MQAVRLDEDDNDDDNIYDLQVNLYFFNELEII